MRPPVRHAIIGCGRVAPNHVHAVRQSPDAEIAWFCDRDHAALARFAAEYGPALLSQRPAEVFADPSVDSVSIATDHAQHAELAAAALKAGKHVLVEKPLALRADEARGLVALAQTRDLRLVTVAQHRFDPVVSEVARLIADGALGKITAIWATLLCGREPSYYADSYWRGTWAGEGGSLLTNQAYHCLDLMLALGGPAAAESCASTILTLGDVLETEDVLSATLRFQNGALGVLSCASATQEFWRSRIEVVGAEGAVSFDINHPNGVHATSVRPGADAKRLLARAAEPDPLPPGIAYYGVSHLRQIGDFLSAIRVGRSPRVGALAGVETLDMILSLYALTGRRAGDARALEAAHDAA
jgi:UDP-N-acetyl-2-amino-2-deoxyglucuronate dehydrogenase